MTQESCRNSQLSFKIYTQFSSIFAVMLISHKIMALIKSTDAGCMKECMSLVLNLGFMFENPHAWVPPPQIKIQSDWRIKRPWTVSFNSTPGWSNVQLRWRTIEFCQTLHSKMTCICWVLYRSWSEPEHLKVIRDQKGGDMKEFSIAIANVTFPLIFLVIFFTYLLLPHSTAGSLCWILSYCFLPKITLLYFKLWCCGRGWESLNHCSDFPPGFSLSTSNNGNNSHMHWCPIISPYLLAMVLSLYPAAMALLPYFFLLCLSQKYLIIPILKLPSLK